MLSALSRLYRRDLNTVIAELESYPDEAAIWTVRGHIRNPAGNLALHLVGNLSQYIGDDLGGVPFHRDRDAEFSRTGVPRAELVRQLRHVAGLVEQTLGRLDEARLDQPNPRQPKGFPDGATSGELLAHLYGHLNYHLGQINYHRRLTV